MKKLLLLFIIAVVSIPVFATTILVNGQKAEISSVEVKDNNTVFIPLRELEKMGIGTISQGPEGAVEFNTPKMNLLFYKNSDSVRMNSLSLKLPMSTYLSQGKFMVPLAFITKSLGGEYSQAEELIVNITNMPTLVKQGTLKAPVMEKGASNTPVVKTEPKKEEIVEPKTETTKSETTKTEIKSEPKEEPKTEEKVETKTEVKTNVEKYVAPELSYNWFQGTVMAYNKKLNLIDVDLYDAKTHKLVQTTKTHEGSFAFRNLDDGLYFIQIDHAKNPSFKTFTTYNFYVTEMEGKKLNKPINIYRAIKSEGIKEIKKDNATYYEVKWSAVPNVKNYKVYVKSSNSKAKQVKYDAKTESINIPLSVLSKGQTYGVTIASYDQYGSKTGESSDSGWTFKTK